MICDIFVIFSHKKYPHSLYIAVQKMGVTSRNLAETEGFEPSSRKPANAFRVRPVMTTSIRLHMFRARNICACKCYSIIKVRAFYVKGRAARSTNRNGATVRGRAQTEMTARHGAQTEMARRRESLEMRGHLLFVYFLYTSLFLY